MTSPVRITRIASIIPAMAVLAEARRKVHEMMAEAEKGDPAILDSLRQVIGPEGEWDLSTPALVRDLITSYMKLHG